LDGLQDLEHTPPVLSSRKKRFLLFLQ